MYNMIRKMYRLTFTCLHVYILVLTYVRSHYYLICILLFPLQCMISFTFLLTTYFVMMINEIFLVCALQGMKRDPATGIRTKVYGTDEADVPIQMALWAPPAVDNRFLEVD